ncbi:MAG: hypothetical protein ACRDD8_11375 [Bacteroidales bacterium]
MDDGKFNTTMYGYLVYSMVKADFSRRDIDRMMRIISNWGFDDMTLERAHQYMVDIWDGRVELDHTDYRPNRILEKEDAATQLR